MTAPDYIGLRDAEAEYQLPYSSLRAWVKAGVIPAFRLPNGRIFLRRSDIEGSLFKPVH